MLPDCAVLRDNVCHVDSSCLGSDGVAELTQEQHKAECLQRWTDLEQQARLKWGDYKRKRISRKQLEDWLKQQSEMDERTIRGIFNGFRG